MGKEEGLKDARENFLIVYMYISKGKFMKTLIILMLIRAQKHIKLMQFY